MACARAASSRPTTSCSRRAASWGSTRRRVPLPLPFAPLMPLECPRSSRQDRSNRRELLKLLLDKRGMPQLKRQCENVGESAAGMKADLVWRLVEKAAAGPQAAAVAMAAAAKSASEKAVREAADADEKKTQAQTKADEKAKKVREAADAQAAAAVTQTGAAAELKKAEAALAAAQRAKDAAVTAKTRADTAKTRADQAKVKADREAAAAELEKTKAEGKQQDGEVSKLICQAVSDAAAEAAAATAPDPIAGGSPGPSAAMPAVGQQKMANIVRKWVGGCKRISVPELQKIQEVRFHSKRTDPLLAVAPTLVHCAGDAQQEGQEARRDRSSHLRRQRGQEARAGAARRGRGAKTQAAAGAAQAYSERDAAASGPLREQGANPRVGVQQPRVRPETLPAADAGVECVRDGLLNCGTPELPHILPVQPRRAYPGWTASSWTPTRAAPPRWWCSKTAGRALAAPSAQARSSCSASPR